MDKTISIDLSGTKTTEQLHAVLKKTFGFPDFYGGNYPALVDCWSSLRYPDDGMSSVVLDGLEDRLELHVKNLASCPESVVRTVLSAVEAVNHRARLNSLEELIVLVLNDLTHRGG
ncbi:barstar family protein [Mycobacterium sp. URHD0025]|uniref:barstar family protein n=1 Tax=Mycobacterium sp. URHD0025 TaxID=1298864 RepID=UPI0003FF3503|nr:barstar family protein [Mycobacterium sp. URHD0025]